MKAKHHFWSSIVAGGILYFATGSGAAFTGVMLGGFLIDADHILDQWWSVKHHAPFLSAEAAIESNTPGLRGLLALFFRRRRLLRLYLLLHSCELLVILGALSLIYRTYFLIGLFCGYTLHLALDLWRHYGEFSSPFFYFVIYRAIHGFKREKLIASKYV